MSIISKLLEELDKVKNGQVMDSMEDETGLNEVEPITEDYEGHMNNQSIIYVTSLSKLCLATNEILVESSTINEFDILFFTLKENGVEMRYLFNSIADQQ